MTQRLSDVTKITVPRSCVEQVHAHLRRVGAHGHEGLGLWVGGQNGPSFRVSQALIPAQRHIRTADGICVITGPEELHRINVWLYKQRLVLIAQIHSHPGRAYHSSTDDAYAVATTVGCLSLVVPNFAREPFELRRAASYRLDGRGTWREVAARDVERLIEIEG